MTAYPMVLNELATMHLVAAGASIARYGDGEFALCAGRPLTCERGDAELSQRLRSVLMRSTSDCLVGIPNIWSGTPKINYWRKYSRQAVPFLRETAYVSAFITRPDSAPWLDTAEYWTLVESLWKDRDVTLVRGSGRSFTADDLTSARSVREVIGLPLHAWSQYQDLLERVGQPERALLCLGPAATVMAAELADRGVHAIDLGHLGMFWRKHLRGESMQKTDADNVAV